MATTITSSATSRTTSSSSSKTNRKKNNSNDNNKKTFISVHPFHGNIKKNQLTFPSNSKIVVVSKSGQEEDSNSFMKSSGWGWGKCLDTNQVGWFPMSYVTPLSSSSTSVRERKTAITNNRSKVSCTSMATTTTSLDNSNDDDDNVIMGGVSTAKAGTGVRMMTSAYLNDDKLKIDDGNDVQNSDDEDDDSNDMKGKRSNKMKSSLKKLKSRFPSRKKKGQQKDQGATNRPFLFNRKVQEEDPFKPVVRIIDTPTNNTSSPKAA